MYYYLLGLIMSGTLKIYKDNINKKRHVIDRNRVRRLSKTNIKNITCTNVREKYEDKIENFINVIKKELPYVDLTNFYRNIEELKVKEKKLIDGKYGGYNIQNIIIYLLQGDKDDSITHELFHLSSSIYSGGISYAGFLQSGDDFNIGCGLNEAYTALLDDRYFGVDSKCYPVLKPAVIALEKIVGQEKMTKMYFEADLYGLIKFLSNYCTENEIYMMLKDMDEINKYQYKINQGELTEKQKEDFQFKCHRITKTLYRCYIKKLFYELYKNIITKEQFVQFLYKFTDDLSINFKINNWHFNILNHELYNEIMSEFIDLPENNINKTK